METLKEKENRISKELSKNENILFKFLAIYMNYIEKFLEKKTYKKTILSQFKEDKLNQDILDKLEFDLILSIYKSLLINCDYLKDYSMEEKINFIKEK